MLSGTPASIKYTVGVPSAGKSYTRVRWVIEEFLVNQTGILYTNLPLILDIFIPYFEKKGYMECAIRDRLQLIPKEILTVWKKTDPDTQMPAINPKYKEALEATVSGEFDIDYNEKEYQFLGPWTYFQHKDLSGAHILLDEIQELVHTKSSKKLKTEWNDWLSTIRHEGCTIEFMTQMDARVPSELKGIAETKLEIIPNKTERFPMLPIQNYDWYQLWKSWFGYNMNSSTVTEYSVGAGGKRKKNGSKKYRFDPFFFKFYDSYNKTTSNKETERAKEEWERMGKCAVGFWFFKRNWYWLILLVVYSGLGWFFLCDSGIKKTLDFISKDHKGSRVKYLAKKEGLTVEQYKEKVLIKRIKESIKEENEAKEKEFRKNNPVVKTNQKAPLNKEEPGIVENFTSKEIYLTFLPKDESYAIMSNGDRLQVGSIIPRGKFKDKKLVAISFVERCIVLNDGGKISFE